MLQLNKTTRFGMICAKRINFVETPNQPLGKRGHAYHGITRDVFLGSPEGWNWRRGKTELPLNQRKEPTFSLSPKKKTSGAA